MEKEIKKINLDMVQASLRNQTTTAQFRGLFGYANLAEALEMCYKKVVEERGFKATIDEATKRHIERVAKWLGNENRTTWGLIIHGSYGNGKTTMIKAIAKLVNLAQIGMRIVSALDIANMAVNATTDFEKLKRIELLAMDDIGTEQAEVKNYGNTITPVTEILVRRYNEQRFTIITTNYNTEKIVEKYGGYIGDRLNEMFDTIQYNNQSYRKINKGGVK